MADRDGSAIHICLVTIQTEFLLYSQILRRERLIDLNAIQVGQAQVSAFEGLANRWCRTDTHNLWWNTNHTPGDEASHRLQVMLSHSIPRCQDNTGSSIVDATGIAWRDHAPLAETRR